MEKLDLNTFRKIKQKVIEYRKKYVSINEKNNEEKNEQSNEYIDAIKSLLNYDLSDIDFEEWKGMYLENIQDMNLNFSKTKANLDFSLIEYHYNYHLNMFGPSFKSCKIKNFDFENEEYLPSMFDSKFIKENEEYFLSENAPNDIYHRFYSKTLNPTDIQENSEVESKFREANIANQYKILYQMLGREKFCELCKKNPKFVEKICDSVGLKNRIEFINKYGIDNIMTLDEETNGIFSHVENVTDIYLSVFAEADKEYKIDVLTYDTFKNRMYEILLHSRDRDGFLRGRRYQDYDFIQGDFRKEHQEIFFDGDASIYIKNKFYTRSMTAEDVRQNLKLIELLQNKDLSKVFNKDIMTGICATVFNEKGEKIGGLPSCTNMAEYMSNILGNRGFLKLCADYGKCLDKIFILDVDENETEQSIRNKIETEIYDEITKKGLEYFEDLPLSFKEKYPELFLPETIDLDLREKFCTGKLTYEDIRKHPEMKDILLDKKISVGFRELKYGFPGYKPNGEKDVSPLWKKCTEQEIINLAEKYGLYLDDVNQDLFKNCESLIEIEMAIQKNIEENILNRVSPLEEDAPQFFRDKHPELFLDDNAPDELKETFYSGRRVGKKRFDNQRTKVIAVKEMSFEIIKEHPEWRKFFVGKDLSRSFPKEYEKIFKQFGNEKLIKIGTKYPETIKKMVEGRKEDVLEKWYKATGGKFVPHHIVMLNFPEQEIDSFLENLKRWLSLMKIDNYNLNDDGKTAMLKIAYVMGVFKGDDDGFNKTMKLFTDIPMELLPEEYDKVINKFSNSVDEDNKDLKVNENDKKLMELFKKSYTLSNNGNYVLRINKQKEKSNVKVLRGILEETEISRILTPEKAHQMFDSFAMEYNEDFVQFFNNNIEEILSNSEYIKDISLIQRQFADIVKTNSGRRLTLEVAQDYIKSIAYENIEIGNENVAEQAKIAGYSQRDFEAIQKLFNEGETREYSSIPRIMR